MMARMLAVVSGSLLLALLWAGPRSTAARETGTAGAGQPLSLPSSLDLLYPPQAQGPVLLLAMHGMNTALTGILVDLFEEDWPGVAANCESFQVRFEETSALVPEWKDRFDREPVTGLGHAVESGEPDRILGAVQDVGAVCHHCHVDNMVPVQQKYHWPDFGLITLEDPILRADMGYPQFMQMLNVSLTGIGVDVEQDQPENARVHLSALKARMSELTNSCDACHDTARAYFVDQSVHDLITQLEALLEAPQPDALPRRAWPTSAANGSGSANRGHRPSPGR